MKKITAYQCEFCKHSLFLSRAGAKKHEEKCWLNPKRKSCATCLHVYHKIDMGESEYVWFCAANEAAPFKKKIENCESWQLNSDGIFDDGNN